MSKYGDFKVVRTERRTPKKATDPNVDADGMREYSFLKCPHCYVESIEILSSALRTGKSLVVQEHIAVCPSYAGERPVKRCKAVKLVPYSNNEVQNRLLKAEQEAAKNQQELTKNQQELAEQKEEIKKLENKVKEQERLLASLDKQVLLRALVATQEENKRLKVHLKTLHASMEELEVECDEYEQDVAESWREATERIRRIRALDAPILRLLTPI
jgi:DNA repair exonuclease SbcCD ATPase subunit